MSNTSSQLRHYPALDGLRGIAILLILFYHNFAFVPLANYGWLGVDLFFVLSGFLITGILLHSLHTPGYFRNFYARRVLRIFPLYYLALCIIFFVLPSIKGFPYSFDFYTHNQSWFWLYMQNWLFIVKGWGEGPYILHHFWSLAVEEQFYIIWPFLLFFIRKPAHLLWVCLLLLFSIIAVRCYLWLNKDQYPFYLRVFMCTRIDGILLGAMLAITQTINAGFLKKYAYRVIASLIAINIPLAILSMIQEFRFPYWGVAGYTTIAAVFALIIYEAVNERKKILYFILTIPLLRFLGKISYGFYVFHWPVYLLLYPYINRSVANLINLEGFALKFTVSFCLTAIGFLLSVLSYFTYERMWLKLKDRFR